MNDAVTAQVSFWLWRDIAASDYLAFEVSTDGVTWIEKARWATGTVGWELQVIQVDECALVSNCWVGWRFYSDASGTGQGPWLDDISISKYRPGDVTVSGSFQYDDPATARRPARSLRVTVYEVDPDGLDWLAEGTTDTNGRFQFGPFMDWDWDGTNLDVNAKRLDLQLVFTSDGVTNFARTAYEWATEVRQDVSPGASGWDYGALTGDLKQRAMWILQDLVRGRDYIRDHTGIDPGSVDARWERGQNTFLPCANGSCFWPFGAINGAFIADNVALSNDVVLHEMAHGWMYNSYGFFWYNENTLDSFLACVAQPHYFFDAKTPLCAYTEGWADFAPLAINGDQCFDFGVGPCTGVADTNYYNVETHGRGDGQNTGDTVEGRVAGALYDLYDNNNDGFDQANFGFSPIGNIVRQSPHELSFSEFWNSWKSSGMNRHLAVQAIYQNTIDYDQPPSLLLPDIVLLDGLAVPNRVDLWQSTIDEESSGADMSYRLVSVSDARCGTSLNGNRYIGFAPTRGWLGSCVVRVSVSDGIKSSESFFTAQVHPIRGRSFLPAVMNNATGP
jgi:hypothetical protein